MAENIENNGCSQRDNAEHEGYVKASRSFNRIWKERDSAQPRLLEAILYKDNFNRAYKRVKANKGAPGIDGMTIAEALPYLKEHQQEITDRIYRGKYTPSPVRRVEIPKPDGGVRKLGIPTVVDRTLQQAITQQFVPIYEPLFAEGSYGYRPNSHNKESYHFFDHARTSSLVGLCSIKSCSKVPSLRTIMEDVLPLAFT